MEIISLLILTALVYLIFLIKNFRNRLYSTLERYEKQYLVFSNEEIEKTFQFYKEEDMKLKSAREKVEDERKMSSLTEELFREYKKQEIYTSRVKERLSLMIESNLAVLNGKKKIFDALSAPSDYWMDSMQKDEQKEIDEFINKLKS